MKILGLNGIEFEPIEGTLCTFFDEEFEYDLYFDEDGEYNGVRIDNAPKDILEYLYRSNENSEGFFDSIFDAKNIEDYDITERLIGNEIMTIVEASEIWGKEVSTLRRVFANNTSFKIGIDTRKAGKVWLVKKSAMERVYGKIE